VFVGGDDPNLALDVNSQVGTLRHSAPRTCHEFRVDQGGLRPQANLGETPLHVCSIFGATRVAALLLANGADPFLTDSEEWAAFHYAARFGHQEVLEMVRRKMRFDSGFDGEQQPVTSDGWSALHIAARFQKLDIITYLLSAGAAKESRDKLGRTALHVAVKHGLADAVQHLLAHRLDVDAKTDTGESPGHVALRGGELLLDLIDLLLTHGLNMEARDNNGETMLHYAARVPGAEAVRRVASRGAHLQVKNNNGWSALHIAADQGNLDAIQALIQAGCDIDIRDNEGGSWLFLLHKDHYSQVTKFLVTADTRDEGHVEAPRMLLKGTALIYTQEPQKPVRNASCERHFAMIKLVSALAAGEAFDPAGADAAKLLHYSAKYGHSELISFLVYQGTDLAERNSNGLTAMHIAAKHGHIQVVQLLMSNGMEVNVADEMGWTPLHHACCSGKNAMVSFLLEAKAAVNAQTANGEAPLHLAFGNGHMEIIRLLIQADPPAERSLQDAIGFTPVQYATIELADRMRNAGWGADVVAAGADAAPPTPAEKLPAEEEGEEAKSSRCAIS
jgi:ankyrin repeat protein